jgi:hypothetical protein
VFSFPVAGLSEISEIARRYKKKVPRGGEASMTEVAQQAIRDAALRAASMYPAPVGELIRRELMSWVEIGHLLDGDKLIMQLTDHINGQGAD